MFSSHGSLFHALMLGILCQPNASEASQTLDAPWWSPLVDLSTVGQSSVDGPGGRTQIFSNLWLHHGRWYALLPRGNASSSNFETALSANTHARILPTANVTQLLAALEVGWVAGTTLFVEQPFPLLHNHKGHWLETVIPLWESMGRNKQHHTRHLLLWGSRRSDISDWMNATLNVALMPMGQGYGGLDGGLKVDVIDSQALDQIPSSLWIGFEKLTVVRDRYSHPKGETGFLAEDHGNAWNHDGCQRFVKDNATIGFENTMSAREFSKAAFQLQRLPPHDPGNLAGFPKTITLLSSYRSQESIENMDAVLGMLWRVANHIGWRVRPFVVDSQTPFAAYLAAMRRTGLLVGRHSHVLSNAIFLPPGGFLYEFIPYNVEWGGVTLMNQNFSLSAHQIGHSSWHANEPRWMVYRSRQDANYKDWTPQQCHSRECLAAHERAGLVVDVYTVEKLLLELAQRRFAEL